MKNVVITPEIVRERLEAAFYTLDIPAEVERHTSTRLHSVTRGKQYGGACPFPDCFVDTDGFSVWPVLTPRGKHYYCRGCRRSGDILKLVQDIKGLGFTDACIELGIPNPYLDGDSARIHSNSQVKRRTPKAEQWQLDELDYLTNIYQRAKLALRRDRARAYLSERAIPFELAQTQELGYIPALSEVEHSTPELERFRRWCDRIIFPILTPKGEIGYCGRSLFLWEPGMDEDEHKRRIDAYNLQMKEQYGDKALWHQMPRWKYTYQQGFFNWQAVKKFDTLVFVEGAFDALACMAGGILNVIPIGTTGLDAGLLPISVCSAIMGLDIDGPGRKAAKQLATSLRRKGIDTQVCAPTGGKDWSATYRVDGEQGLASLKQTIAAQNVFESAPETCADCGTHMTDDSREFFYWPISEDAFLCFCTMCRDMQNGMPICIQQEVRV
jgi:DNA primase